MAGQDLRTLLRDAQAGEIPRYMTELIEFFRAKHSDLLTSIRDNPKDKIKGEYDAIIEANPEIAVHTAHTLAQRLTHATTYLADLGADVIKVERPGTGDPFRAFKGGLYSPHYQTYNRNKRSIALDTKDPEDLAVLHDLVATADVFIQNFRPGVAERLGVDRFFIQVIGVRGQWTGDAECRETLAQVDRETWLRVVPPVAEAAAASGIPTTFPKVFLTPGEPFECAGRVADNYFIFPNGRVYRCPLCEDFPLHSLTLERGRLDAMPPINEKDLFALDIPEGCVMNRLIQPGNLVYGADGLPAYRIACCMLKEEILPP